VDGEWNPRSLGEQLETILDGGPPDPRQLAARLVLLGGADRSPRFGEIVDILTADSHFQKHFSASRSIRIRPGEQKMQAKPAHLTTLPVPQLSTCRDLARWLGLSDNDLDWFAGLGRRYSSRVDPRLNHYSYEWRERRHGYPRLVEKPKSRLKSLQREILATILNRVPVHDNAHGFRRHRSCRSSAVPHAGSEVVLRMDLKDFFISITRARVEGVFRMIGYPESVASRLAGICTHRTALHACGDRLGGCPLDTRQRLREWHLAQGAPTSPALANLCAWRMDARLSGFSDHFQLTYTRYADDLAFSGPITLFQRKEFFEPLIGAIALEEGFRVNHRKTRWMRASQRQHFCGITVNQHPNLSRKEFDQLKALLHNCIKFGPLSQNREQHSDFRRHLEGRVSYAMHLNRERGIRLRDMLRLIDWEKDYMLTRQ
jgi:hypothetical protein